MANTNSNLIANAALVPPTMNRAGQLRGVVRIAQDNFELTGTPATADTFGFVPLPINAHIISLRMAADDLATTSMTIDLGIRTSDQVTVKIADAFAAGIDVAAATRLTEYIDGPSSSIDSPLFIGDRLWEFAGDTIEPAAGTEYEIYGTIAAAVAGLAGTIAFQIQYVID